MSDIDLNPTLRGAVVLPRSLGAVMLRPGLGSDRSGELGERRGDPFGGWGVALSIRCRRIDNKLSIG